jgi:hypothetical protein
MIIHSLVMNKGVSEIDTDIVICFQPHPQDNAE